MVEKMERETGFQQTEVGVIPSDWEIRKLENCLLQKPDYGINAGAVAYDESLPVYLRITDITDDGKYSKKNIVSVNHPFSSSFYLGKGDLVFARTGASVGKTYLYNPKDGKLVFAGFLVRIKTNPDLLVPEYFQFYTQISFYWKWIRTNSLRTGQPGINGSEYGELPIILPPKAEQTAIATALSDMDGLINGIEKLLAKKRIIRQGAMQELLRPKEGWVVKKLGDVASIRRGASPRPIKDPKWFSNTGRGWIRISDVTSSHIYLNTTNQYLSEIGASNSVAVDKGDLIMSICATIGVPIIINIPACIHDGFVLFRDYETEVDTFFFFYFLEFNTHALSEKGQPGTQKNLNTTIVGNIEISFPKIEEQRKIGLIIRDMDTEIEALEKKLQKYRLLKQGMMQTLLTGKVRLL
jgi:type I restriction enzyme S subunit